MFVEERKKAKGEDYFKYFSEYYGFPVMTKQKLKIKQYFVTKIVINKNGFNAQYLDTITQNRQGVLNLNKYS